MMKQKTTPKKAKARRGRPPKKAVFDTTSPEVRKMADIYAEAHQTLYCKLPEFKRKLVDKKENCREVNEFVHAVSKLAERKIYTLLNKAKAKNINKDSYV